MKGSRVREITGEGRPMMKRIKSRPGTGLSLSTMVGQHVVLSERNILALRGGFDELETAAIGSFLERTQAGGRPFKWETLFEEADHLVRQTPRGARSSFLCLALSRLLGLKWRELSRIASRRKTAGCRSMRCSKTHRNGSAARRVSNSKVDREIR